MSEREILKDQNLISEIETELMNNTEIKNLDSQNKFNSLIIKDQPLLKPDKYYERRGNCFFFVFDTNGYPKIIIGPHCK